MHSIIYNTRTLRSFGESAALDAAPTKCGYDTRRVDVRPPCRIFMAGRRERKAGGAAHNTGTKHAPEIIISRR